MLNFLGIPSVYIWAIVAVIVAIFAVAIIKKNKQFKAEYQLKA